MARTDNLTNFLDDVAVAIKSKKGYESTQKIPAENFDTEISSITTVNNQNKTITPTTSQQIITADQGYTGIGTATVQPVTSSIDQNIVAGNIKKNVVILGVTGSFEGTDTSDANATVSNIEEGKTAYVNGSKLTGTLPVANFVGNRNQSIQATCYDEYSLFDLHGQVSTLINSSDPSSPLSRAIIANGDDIEMMVSYSNVASAIGLTANILKKDEEVLGITGTYEGIDTSDANATAADIAQGKTAYVDGIKITGTAVASHDSVKLFVSTTAMNNDADKVLGDIAIVYDDGTLTGLYVVTSVNDTLTYTPLPTQLSAITSGDVYLNKVVMGADNTIVTGTIPVTASEVDTAVATTEDILGGEPGPTEIQTYYEIEYD